MTDHNEVKNRPSAADLREIPVSQILGMLWRGRWIIACFTVLTAGLGAYLAEQRGTIYRATTRLYVERQNLNILGGAPDLFLGSVSGNYANTQAALLRSSHVLAEVASSPEVRDLEIFGESHNRVAWLKKNLRVSVGKKDDIISAAIDSRHVDDACVIVNRVVDVYRDDQVKQKEDVSATAISQLTSRKSSETKKLSGYQKDLLKHFDNFGSSSADSIGIIKSRHSARTAALQRLLEDKRAAESTLRSATSVASNPGALLRYLASSTSSVRAAAADPAIDRIRGEIREHERQLASLRSRLSESVPVVATTARRIQELRKAQKDRESALADSLLKMIRDERAALGREEERLSAEVVADAKAVEAMQKRAFERSNLERKIADARMSLNRINDRLAVLETNRLDDEKTKTMKIAVLDVAKANTATVASSKATLIAVATFLGVLLGAILAWLRGMFDHRIRSVDDISQRVGLPVLAVFPRTNIRKGSTVFEAWASSSALAEAARSLRTAVYHGMSEAGKRVLHVTSPDPGDGKSITIACLGLAMAQAGQKTLIIDADMRKPRQDQLLGVPNELGLSSQLRAQKKGFGIQRTQQPDLDVLTSGPLPDNPAELLGASSFADLLNKVAGVYDRILVDSPPVLPVADARIIGEKCHFTLLVARIEKTTLRKAGFARDDLVSLGARMIGSVVNDMPQKIGYGYGYGYGYGGNDAQQTQAGTRRKKARTLRRSSTRT